MPPDFDLDKYITRSGYRGPLAPTLETLSGLQAAHVDAIAFEGIDPLLGRPVNIDLAAVQAKIVDGRRGGYCFEQNALLKAALEAIGFAVTPLSARVRWRLDADAPLTPRTHMMLKVDLPEGPYLADVGFGSCLLDTPLRMVPDIEQPTVMGTFRLTLSDGLHWLAAKQPAGWRMMYVFDLVPQIHADYVLGNWFTSTSPSTPFTSVLILERLTSEARYRLVNRRFVIEARDGEVKSERIIETPEALRNVIDEVFGVALPVPADDVWARTES
ncbi:N-hydroxyarylamine O-acetyltransferase [Bradyrhizobium sp. SSBR45G]|uniref:arylamine N-acetyltransferase family protein n=1 Tax=unclassified Bradyrhizobium TaxID=2631580 RepID=UPI002342B150|nr:MULTISPECIES: arylamine N-acetyltransferase [unclassified Bradyrhizobium]GLH81233.1 N-hydroxyarylamine O-acetyltransferase [Bradyrhizobium sp. SSBR45G]GLH88747.1 N-hydroxyarylamine O-acetyltransferase [Bradyrhizobium sp. SSBR45R]